MDDSAWEFLQALWEGCPCPACRETWPVNRMKIFGDPVLDQIFGEPDPED